MTREELEQIIVARRRYEAVDKSIGQSIIESGRPYYELQNEEIEWALFYIIRTSETEKEILRRVKEEFHYPYEPSICSLTATTTTSEEVKMVYQAIGRITMKNGTLVQLIVFSPRGEIITM